MEVGGAASKAVCADSEAGGAAMVAGGAALQAPGAASMVLGAAKQVARAASVRGGPASEEGDAAMEAGGAATVEGDAARTQQQLPAGMDSATSFLLKIHLLGNRKNARKDVKCFSFEMVVGSDLSNYKDFIDSVTKKVTKSVQSSIVPLKDEAPTRSMTFPPSQNLEPKPTANKKRKGADSNSGPAGSVSLEITSRKKRKRGSSNSGA